MVLFNKKGQIELADLAGFILIFVSVILFGYIFVRAAPTARIEFLGAENTDFLVEKDLIDFLSYEKIYDKIILNDFDYVEEKFEKIFICDDRVNRWIVIYKDGNLEREISCSYHLNKPEKMKYIARKNLDNGIIIELTTLYNPFWRKHE